MSDHIEVDGRKYFEQSYLQGANNTAKRRGERIKELEAELAEARKDTERLNWIDERGKESVRRLFGNETQHGWAVDEDSGTLMEGTRDAGYIHQSVREAIDAAMEKL